MNLKEARVIARQVGATIEERKRDIHKAEPPTPEEEREYIVRLGVIRIGSNGTREPVVLHAASPAGAAHTAVVETAKAAHALAAEARRVYAESDLIFGAGK